MLTHAICARNHNPKPVVNNQSKDELDGELNIAREICLAGRLAKAGAGGIQNRITELRMVESVKKFCPQLERGTFIKGKGPDDGQIAQHERLSAKPWQVRWQRPYIIC